VTEERLKKVGRFTRAKTEGYSYDLPEEARAELGFAVLDTAVVIAEVPQARAALDALWCAAKQSSGARWSCAARTGLLLSLRILKERSIQEKWNVQRGVTG
jgi:hypothetical protein